MKFGRRACGRESWTWVVVSIVDEELRDKQAGRNHGMGNAGEACLRYAHARPGMSLRGHSAEAVQDLSRYQQPRNLSVQE